MRKTPKRLSVVIALSLTTLFSTSSVSADPCDALTDDGAIEQIEAIAGSVGSVFTFGLSAKIIAIKQRMTQICLANDQLEATNTSVDELGKIETHLQHLATLSTISDADQTDWVNNAVKTITDRYDRMAATWAILEGDMDAVDAEVAQAVDDVRANRSASLEAGRQYGLSPDHLNEVNLNRITELNAARAATLEESQRTQVEASRTRRDLEGKLHDTLEALQTGGAVNVAQFMDVLTRYAELNSTQNEAVIAAIDLQTQAVTNLTWVISQQIEHDALIAQYRNEQQREVVMPEVHQGSVRIAPR